MAPSDVLSSYYCHFHTNRFARYHHHDVLSCTPLCGGDFAARQLPPGRGRVLLFTQGARLL